MTEKLVYNPEDMREIDPALLELFQDRAGVPSINVVKTPVNPTKMGRIIKHGSSLTDALLKVVKGMDLLDNENKLLTRHLYTGKNKYRNDHGFKTLEMLGKSVKKTLLHFPSDYLDNFVALLPKVLSYYVHLPPVALAEYAGLLVRITFHSLDRIMHCCHLIAVHASCRTILCHEVDAAVFRLAVASRMWAIAMYTKKFVSKVLQSIYGISVQLPVGKSYYKTDIVAKIFDGFTTDEKAMPDPSTFMPLADKVLEDIGEKVGRNFVAQEMKRRDKIVQEFSNPVLDFSFEKKYLGNNNNNSMKKKDVKKNNSDASNQFNFKSIEDVNNFIESQSKLRKINRKESVTRKLSQDEWKSLKRNVLAGLNHNQPNKSIKLCKQLICKALIN